MSATTKTVINPQQYRAKKLETEFRKKESIQHETICRYEAATEPKPLGTYPSDIHKLLGNVSKKYPNGVELISAIEQEVALANLSVGVVSIHPILLVGPPGVGKTALIEQIGSILQLNVHRLSLSQGSEPFMLSGSPSKYGNTQPGAIAQALLKSDTANPILLLDEIDKAPPRNDRGDVLSPLLTLLEPNTAHRFRDECLELDLDASSISYIATANSLEVIPDPIKSRFQIINIEPPTREQVPVIIRSIFTDLLEENSWGDRFERYLPEPVIKRLASEDPRCIRKLLRGTLANAALRNTNESKRIRITKADIPKAEKSTSPSFGFIPSAS